MEFTGERYVPELGGEIALEHLQRYHFASELVEGRAVLDVASGEGYGSELLARRAASVVGVDIDADAISHAAQRYGRSNLSFLEGSAAELPIDDDSFDVIISFETIEHHDRHVEMMREFKRVLRPGGLVVISSPDRVEYSERTGSHNEFHVKELDEAEFRSLLEEHFERHQLFGQRVYVGSLLLGPDAVGTESIALEQGTVDRRPGLFRPLYLVALASDGELPAVPSTVMIDLDHQVSPDVFERLSASSEWLEGAHERLLAEHGELAAALGDMRARAEAAEQQVTELRAQLDELLSSRSWRVTAPLREISDRWGQRGER